jgi:hypothetical protein
VSETPDVYSDPVTQSEAKPKLEDEDELNESDKLYLQQMKQLTRDVFDNEFLEKTLGTP